MPSLRPAQFHVEIAMGLPRNGLVVVECKMGKLLSNWRPLVVMEDAMMVAELQVNAVHGTAAHTTRVPHAGRCRGSPLPRGRGPRTA